VHAFSVANAFAAIERPNGRIIVKEVDGAPEEPARLLEMTSRSRHCAAAS
jgi:hypothetical protein